MLIACAVSYASQQNPTPEKPVVSNPVASRDASIANSNQEYAANDIFHMVGIPNLKRNNRVNLILTDQEMRFEKKDKKFLVVPYNRVRSVEVLSGERHYGKATYGAALATPFGVGALFILKKRNVDTMVLEYTNEQGGVMNVVVQFPQNQGIACGRTMSKHGIEFIETTNPASAPPLVQKTGEKP